MNSDGWMQRFRAQYNANYAAKWDQFMPQIASPIERLMIAYLLSEDFESPKVPPSVGYDFANTAKRYSMLGITSLTGILGRTSTPYVILTQPKLKIFGNQITPDFGIVAIDVSAGQAPIAVAVELDGHDFHERTKQQAERDKRRDRDLLSAGWAPIRFTGSEVVRSPETVFTAWIDAMNAERRKRGVVEA